MYSSSYFATGDLEFSRSQKTIFKKWENEILKRDSEKRVPWKLLKKA
jgi:hypothetical protein